MFHRILAVLGIFAIPASFHLLTRMPPAPIPADPAPRPAAAAAAAPAGDWTRRAFAHLAALEYHASTGAHGLQAPNRSQELRTYFRRDGIEVVPRRHESPSWRFVWRTVRYGRPGDWTPVIQPQPVADGPRVTYAAEDLSEWYENRSDGIEQGFTVARRPAGSGELRIEADVAASLRARLAGSGKAIDFYDANDVHVLHYAQLAVWDAAGKTLDASFEVTGDRVAIVVDDNEARYPVTVDPILTNPSWTATGTSSGDMYGFSVATAGDVNADGFSDVLVGAPRYDGDYADEGAVFLFPGSAGGLPVSPSWIGYGDQANARFGEAAATAGDVNGDGYDDVIIGAFYYTGSLPLQGRVHVYHGSASGLGATAAWTIDGEVAYAGLGSAASTAGDVDGDGYADVIVGALGFTDGEEDEGRAYVYHGSASGLAPSAAWSVDGNQISAQLGFRVGTAGDVNADGYSDVVVAAHLYDDGGPDRGAVWVYHGSSSGLHASAAWMVTGYDNDGQLGYGVGAAGDVNGDGYADLVVGVPFYDGSFTDQGLVNIYAGSASGLESYAQWSFFGTGSSSEFGSSVGTAGDVNGDGYADIVVGAPAAGTISGSAYVYHGSPIGPVTGNAVSTAEPASRFGAAVATAGDVDGDGFSDVIVGAPRSGDGGPDVGAAYLYRGSPGNLQATPGWTTQVYQEDAYYGWSVASAGDVNGDGYSDALVGATGFDVDDVTAGAAFLYLGGADGLSYTQAWMAAESLVEFASSLDGAGDVNGDGYDDVIVGSPYHDFGVGPSGAAFLYLGGPSGPSTAPDWIGDDGQLDSRYGLAVGSAGDVDGDGFADVVVGAPLYDDGASNAGAVFVYRGAETGPPLSPDWSAEGGQDGAFLGWAVDGAGDTNRDGFADLIVGASGFNAGEGGEGKVLVYLGSPTGLASDPSWSVVGDGVNAALGYAVATAGDINRDGFSDIILGAPGHNAGRGAAYVYRGSPTGPYEFPSWTEQAAMVSARYGTSVATAGDVDGDGDSDILVSAPNHDTSVIQAGRVFCYFGSPIGLPNMPNRTFDGHTVDAEFGRSVASAGDVNGDGFADILIGEPGYMGAYPGEGRALLYYGNGGQGRHLVPRQRRTDDSAPVALGGMSDSPSSFLVIALGRTAAGRGPVSLEIEVKPLDVAFDGDGTLVTGALDSGLEGVDIAQLVTGLAPGTPYRWRVRIMSDSPFFPPSPWFTPAGNGPTEIDLRTAGSLIAVGDPDPIISLVSFSAPYPNPFSGSTQMTFAIPRSGHTRVAIYDLRGRRVKVLIDGRLAAGSHPVTWNGRDTSGARVANGIYFARVVQEGEVATRTLTLLR